MTEETALELMRQGDEEGLHWFIDRFSRYVSTIIWNIAGHALTVQDAEEVTADVFLTFWQYRSKPYAGKAKGYLAAIARTRALDWLKQSNIGLTLEYDDLCLVEDGPEVALLEREAKSAIREEVLAFPPDDREIFLRYYYYCETTPMIAERMGLTPGTVRQRLNRGRDKLRVKLMRREAQCI